MGKRFSSQTGLSQLKVETISKRIKPKGKIGVSVKLAAPVVQRPSLGDSHGLVAEE